LNTDSQPAWAWHPRLPIKKAPVFVWPPRPVAALGYLLGGGLLFSPLILTLAVSLVVWFFLTPDRSHWQSFSPGWITQVFGVNLAVVCLVAGGLHLFFHTYRRQADSRKFDFNELDRNNQKFFAGNQVWDNIFWTCVSGVTLATTYQVVIMWVYANELVAWLDWHSSPVLFVLWFVVLPFWSSSQFYFIHRLLHWKPLYKLAHQVHHRNISIGPWSGLSMHPIEHILFFTSFLIHLVVVSHPLHLFFHVHHKLINSITSHTGFSHWMVGDRPALPLGDFFHQLHHRYFDCNYGGTDVPWDDWFASYHDGTPEGTVAVRQRQMVRRGKAATWS